MTISVSRVVVLYRLLSLSPRFGRVRKQKRRLSERYKRQGSRIAAITPFWLFKSREKTEPPFKRRWNNSQSLPDSDDGMRIWRFSLRQYAFPFDLPNTTTVHIMEI